MPRECVVCAHPNVADFDKLFLEDRFSKKKCFKLIKKKYNVNFVYRTLCRHYTHVEKHIEAMAKATKVHDKKIQSEVLTQQRIMTQLTRNLNICNTLIESFAEKMESSDEPEFPKSFNDLLMQTNRTIDLIMKAWDKIPMEHVEDEDSLMKRLIYAMHDFPVEWLTKLAERMDWIEGKTDEKTF